MSPIFDEEPTYGPGTKQTQVRGLSGNCPESGHAPNRLSAKAL
jgi:hypothetical protein